MSTPDYASNSIVVLAEMPVLISRPMLKGSQLRFGAGLVVAALVFTLWPVVADEPVQAPLRDLKLVRSYGVTAQIFDKVVDMAVLQKGAGAFFCTRQ